MSPKKKILKPKAKKTVKKSINPPKLKTSKTPTSIIDNSKKINKPHVQNVNVNVSVSPTDNKKHMTDKPPQVAKPMSARSSARSSGISSIIPQYIQGNPPPFMPNINPPPFMQNTNQIKQSDPFSVPVLPASIMSRIASLDSIPTSIKSRPQSLYDEMSEMSEVSFPLSELSFDEIPFGLSMQSVESYNTAKLDKNDAMAKLVSESIPKTLRPPRDNFKEIMYDDGNLKFASENYPQFIELSKSDEISPQGIENEYDKMSVSERIKAIEDNVKKRGRKPGTKNRPKEEITAEKNFKEAEKNVKVVNKFIRKESQVN
jgi:hypothetical protein